MDLNSENIFFQPIARLLLQLGDKLIKNKNIALLELIKNSYNADSLWANVTIKNLKRTLKIEFNGETFDKFNGFWSNPFEVKSSHKIELSVFSQFGEESTKVLNI